MVESFYWLIRVYFFSFSSKLVFMQIEKTLWMSLGPAVWLTVHARACFADSWLIYLAGTWTPMSDFIAFCVEFRAWSKMPRWSVWNGPSVNYFHFVQKSWPWSSRNYALGDVGDLLRESTCALLCNRIRSLSVHTRGQTTTWLVAGLYIKR